MANTLNKLGLSVVSVGDLASFFDRHFPLSWAESYDNVGLLLGDRQAVVSGVLTSLDVSLAVLEEAVDLGCNVVLSHHPLIFKPLKRLTGDNLSSRLVTFAIQHGLALYAGHTNVDNSPEGLNKQAATLLGLRGLKFLANKLGVLSKLVCFVPTQALDVVRKGLHEAGGGAVGHYDQCSFSVLGQGRFLPKEGSVPYQGSEGVLEQAEEWRLELIFPTHLQQAIEAALLAHHPYEEVAYYVQALSNTQQGVGAGVFGVLPSAVSLEGFLKHIGAVFGAQALRHSALDDGLLQTKQVQKVAFCGGAGSGLVPQAIASGADIYISAELKHHDYVDYQKEIILCDIGHYESESHIKQLFLTQVQNNFPNIVVHASKRDTNPIQHFMV